MKELANAGVRLALDPLWAFPCTELRSRKKPDESMQKPMFDRMQTRTGLCDRGYHDDESRLDELFGKGGER